MLAQLQCADKANDGPSIRGGEAIGVGIHDAVALRHDIEEVSVGGFAQAIDMIGRWRGKPSSHDISIAVAERTVARCTIDVESVLTASKQLEVERIRIARCMFVAIPSLGARRSN